MRPNKIIEVVKLRTMYYMETIYHERATVERRANTNKTSHLINHIDVEQINAKIWFHQIFI